MVNVQTGNMLDVVVEGKSIGLKQRDSDHRKYEVIWLPAPEGLRDVLAAEIARLNPPERQTANSQPTSEEREEQLSDRLWVELRTQHAALDEIEVALISIADGVNPADAVQKAFEIINRERQKMIG